MNEKPLVSVRGLKTYFPVYKGIFRRHAGDVRAVDDIDLDIYPGETVGLVGESGCGKTTVGRSILQLIAPTAGTVVFDGIELSALSKRALRRARQRFQIVFQDPFSSLNPRMTIGAILDEALASHHAMDEQTRRREIAALLERVGLQASYAQRYPHEFSGGQRQRIGIARALAPSPDFIVCDESISALDVSIQAQIINLLEDIQEERGIAYLFIAHDLSAVRHISDRIAVMYLGKIVELAPTEALFHAPTHPYTQALLSSIPVPDPRAPRDRIILEGDVPSPLHPPSGCAFRTRCPFAFERCATEVPALLPQGPSNADHRSACHLPEPPTRDAWRSQQTSPAPANALSPRAATRASDDSSDAL